MYKNFSSVMRIKGVQLFSVYTATRAIQHVPSRNRRLCILHRHGEYKETLSSNT